MPSIEDVRRQIQACPDRYIFWTQKEIRALPKILDEGESIHAVTSGFQNGATWLAVATDRRVIFVNCGMFYGVHQVQMPLDRIQSIDHQSTIIFGVIRVFDGVNVFVLSTVKRGSILPFVKAVEEAMYAMRHPQNQPGAQPAGNADVASQLMKLADLKEKGYLTDQEFQIQKKKLLG